MSRSQSWIEGIGPQRRFSAVAVKALKQRLKAVSDLLPLAAKRAENDAEYVHQLRVATRRAVAALKLFRELLPAKRAEWLQKQLRRVRRSAGAARDLDVLLQRLSQGPADADLQGAVRQIRKERRRAQRPLKAAYKRVRRKGLKRQTRKFLKQIRWKGDSEEPRLAEAARCRLKPIVDDFFTAAQGTSDPVALHVMRVRGKRLRYVMELLAGAFDRSFRTELYPVFAEVQQRLGDVNDHVTAAAMYETWMQRSAEKNRADLFAQLLKAEQRQLDQHCQEFQAWWTQQRLEDLHDRFDRLLRPAATAGEQPLACNIQKLTSNTC